MIKLNKELILHPNILRIKILLLNQYLLKLTHISPQSTHHTQPYKIQFHHLYQLLWYFINLSVQIHIYLLIYNERGFSWYFHQFPWWWLWGKLCWLLLTSLSLYLALVKFDKFDKVWWSGYKSELLFGDWWNEDGKD